MSQHDLVEVCEWPNGEWCLLEDLVALPYVPAGYKVIEITERQYFYEYTGELNKAEDCK